MDLICTSFSVTDNNLTKKGSDLVDNQSDDYHRNLKDISLTAHFLS